MRGEHQPTVPRFRPLGRIAPLQQVLLAVGAPLLWLIALLVGAYALKETDAIEIALLLAGGSFVMAFVVLILLRAGRRREERRHDRR